MAFPVSVIVLGLTERAGIGQSLRSAQLVATGMVLPRTDLLESRQSPLKVQHPLPSGTLWGRRTSVVLALRRLGEAVGSSIRARRPTDDAVEIWSAELETVPVWGWLLTARDGHGALSICVPERWKGQTGFRSLDLNFHALSNGSRSYYPFHLIIHCCSSSSTSEGYLR